MVKCSSFSKLVDSANYFAGLISGILIISLVILVNFEAFMRYILNSPVWYSYDLVWMLYGVAALFGGGYALLTKTHTRVDVILERVDPSKERIIEVVYLLVFVLPAIVLLIIGGVETAIYSWKIKEKSMLTGVIPIYPIKALMPVALTLFALQVVSEVCKVLRERS